MSARLDPDLLLVETMLAPPHLDDARSSLEYWERRRQALPLYKRGARREAREMATRWEARVRAAERARFESSLLGRLLTAVGISRLWVPRSRLRRQGLLRLAWAVVPRKLKLVVGGVAAAWLIMVIGAVSAVVLVFVQLA
jgi:hypothetical protein